MWQLNGRIKEALGNPVNKVQFFVPSAEGLYIRVGSKYYGNTEKEVKFKGKPYPVGAKYSCEQIGNVLISKIVADPSQPVEVLAHTKSWKITQNKETKEVIAEVLAMGVGWKHGMSAEEIDNNSFNGHVKTALRNASTGNLQIVMILLGLGVGVGIGWIVSSIVTPMLNPPNPQQIQQTVRPIIEVLRNVIS